MQCGILVRCNIFLAPILDATGGHRSYYLRSAFGAYDRAIRAPIGTILNLSINVVA
jgi:hypothetical protein